MTEKIRVMIVDDHSVIRQGFSIFLQAFADLEAVGEAPNGAEAVRLAKIVEPDVILMDVMMPEMNGIEATRQIIKDRPQSRIIILTSFSDDRKLVKDALQAGAVSYLFKDTSIDELADAIRKTHAGERVLAQEATQMLIQMATEPPGPTFNLTPRELEVLQMLRLGLSNKEIAERMTVSRATVKFHISSLFNKLNANTRTQAVSIAHKYGLID